MGHYELETRAGPAQFSCLSVSTHHRAKQLYYKLAPLVTLTNVLRGLCRNLAASRLSCSCPPSHLNRHSSRTQRSWQKSQGDRGSVCNLSSSSSVCLSAHGCQSTNAECCATQYLLLRDRCHATRGQV